MTYPEHDRLALIKHKSQVIGEFLDWASSEMGWHLAEWDDSRDYDDRMMPISESIPDVLALYFDIDQAKLEEEKRDMLESLRETQ